MNISRGLVGRSGIARVLPHAYRLASQAQFIAQNRNPRMLPGAVVGSRLQSTSTKPAQSSETPLEPFKTHAPSTYPGSPRVHSFYDDPSATWTFVTADPKTRKAIVVDPVLDYDSSAGKISQRSVKGLAAFLQREGYEVVRICETHVHADHLTGAYALKTVSADMRCGMSADVWFSCYRNTRQSTSDPGSSMCRRGLPPYTASIRTS